MTQYVSKFGIRVRFLGVFVLKQYAEAEEHNRQVSLDRLGDSAQLFDELESLYERLSAALPTKTSRAIEQHTAIWFLQVGVRDESIHIALSTLRGHFTPPMRMLRRSIELTGIAWLLHRRPDLVDLWWHRHESTDNERKAKREFKIANLFPSRDAVIWPLYERYTYLSGLVHASMASMASRSRVTGTEQRAELVAEFFEAGPHDQTEPMRTWLFAIDTNFQILRVFVEIFAAELAQDRTVLDLHLNSFETKLLVQKRGFGMLVQEPPRPNG